MGKLTPLPDERAARKARLTAIGGAQPREYSIGERPIAIGSDPANDIMIEDATVSRRHATIAWRRGSFELTDLDSSNGTFVNGRRVRGAVALKGGEELRFGTVQFVLVRSVGVAARGALRPARLAILVAAMFAAGFAGVFYRTNIEAAAAALFSRMFRAAAPAVTASPTPIPPIAAASTATPTAQPTPAGPPPEWLKRLNYYRAMAKLTPVADDPALSQSDHRHAEYMVKNHRAAIVTGALGAEMHTEEPGNPGYTPEGLAAAEDSDMNTWFSSGTPPPEAGESWGTSAWSIDGWMAVPFHRIPMLAPDLAYAGYGEYCEAGVCAAGLNLAGGPRGPMPPPASPAWPIEFPPKGATIGLLTTAEEYPDPRTNCPGYRPPSGLAITLMLGYRAAAHLADFQITGRFPGGPPTNIEACGFDSSSYDNPDPEAQRRARAGLASYGAMVLLPRYPLQRGVDYEVSITANGNEYDWSFAVAR
ncbi:MAG: FHA domain-containing protein [Candidatus Binataceae bacterium]